MKIFLKMYAHLGDLLPPDAHKNRAEIEVAEDVIVEEKEMDVMVLPHRGHGDVFDMVKQNGGVSENTTRYMA